MRETILNRHEEAKRRMTAIVPGSAWVGTAMRWDGHLRRKSLRSIRWLVTDRWMYGPMETP